LLVIVLEAPREKGFTEIELEQRAGHKMDVFGNSAHARTIDHVKTFLTLRFAVRDG
jgi:hypothetical protein